MKKKIKSKEESPQVEKLQAQLTVAEETLRAIRSGEVDALIVSTPQGDQVFTLEGAEQPYRILIEQMGEGAAMLAADDSILYCNSSFASILKTPLETLIGTGIVHYIAPADERVFWELLRQGRHKSSKGEITLLAGDGTFVPAQLSFNTLQKDDAKFVYLVATDLTEQKRIQNELRKARDELEIRIEERTAELVKSEQLWATTLGSIGDAVISTDIDGRITFMNAESEALTGWTLALASTKPVTEVFNIINEYTRRKVEDPVSKVLKKGIVVGLANHTILVKRDGTEVPIDDSGAPIRDCGGKIIGVVLVFRDITERKQVEKAMRESEEKYRSIVETANEGIWIVNADRRTTYVNNKMAEMLGYSAHELVGKSGLDFLDEESRALSNLNIRKRKQGIKDTYEFKLIRRDGSPLWTIVNAKPLFDMDRKFVGTMSMLTDITERKKAEEALRQAHDELEARVQERTAELKEVNKSLQAEINEHMLAEEKIREQATLLDKAHDAIGLRDLEQNLIYWNKGAEYLYGWTAEEAMGKNADDLLYKGKPSNLIEVEKILIKKGEWKGELHQVTKVGKEIIVESRWTLIYDSEGKPKSILIINTDITEKKKIESQLLRAQRMESIGTLAGGIAHDLNNVLTPMMLSLQLLKEKFKDEQSQKLFAILEKNSQRAADLIKQVLSFARGVEGERNPLQAKHLICEIEKIAKETFPRNIEIRTDIPKDLFTISGDATQLHQVIMNLCVNARDAMPDGGILSISAENFFIDETYVQMHTEAKVGSYISIAVADTGIGIPPEVLDRIFEPFFTTKEFGKGTGLGLSTALAIVKSHGGFINVYSEVGKGTTFMVYLPVIKTEMKNVEEQQLELPIGQGELVMVAEDEDSIREVTASTLEEYGYNVLTANDGADAVALYAQNKDKINVILMDMMMPVMDGHASIRAIRRINPGIKIIAVSGLAEKDKLAKIADARVQAFLPKPYTAERLLKTIREIIGTE